MASSVCSSTQNPPRKLAKINYIDLSSNETSPIHSKVNPNTTIDTTLALTMPPPTSNQTTPMVEPLATLLAPRALTFFTPLNTPIEPHLYMSSTNDAPPRTSNLFPHYVLQNLHQTLPQTTLQESIFRPINLSSNRTNAQPDPFIERKNIQQELNNL
nr:hypothetical protein [Tanacetum cinerariifolium]